jgi:hypothetical protein
MDSNMACPECGATGCRDRFEEMLALEFEDPAIFGAVHHITVICFNIQHPATFTEESLAWMRSSLRAIIVDGLSPAELRKLARKTTKGGVQIKRHTKPPEEPSRTHWSMTAADIRTGDPEVYREDIVAWAKSILKDLNIE